MNRMLAAAWVIARRDFVATVWSRTFLLFLLAPIVAIGFGALIGQLTAKADIEASQPTVAVAVDEATAAALQASHDRLSDMIGEYDLPNLRIVDPAPNSAAQARLLLSSVEADVSAVLTGTLERPVLTGPDTALESVRGEVALMIGDARRTGALRGAGVPDLKVEVEEVTTAQSVGSLNLVRHGLARGGQVLVFFLTLMLATMLLSNLVEEKSNKVIEVLAAAVPLDSVFLGKLIAMLGVSIIGIVIWGALAGAGLLIVEDMISLPVTPAMGWPAFAVLLVLYFAANYMRLGAVYLGAGAQASNVREIQTLSMPVTFAQVMIFALASTTVGDEGGTITWLAAVFPLSSPLTMIAMAAQSTALWPHLLALAWQFLWIAVIVRLSARLFRATVLKSRTGESFFAFLKRTPEPRG